MNLENVKFEIRITTISLYWYKVIVKVTKIENKELFASVEEIWCDSLCKFPTGPLNFQKAAMDSHCQDLKLNYSGMAYQITMLYMSLG